MAEPLRATFFALRKRDKMVLLPATIILIILMATILAAFAALNWGALARLGELFQTAMQNTEKMDQDAAAAFIFSIFGLVASFLLFLFPLYLAVAAYEAACLRWMIRGEAPGLFGVTLDYDTWRVYGVYWCWFIGQFALSFAMSIVMMPVMFASMGEVLRNPDPESMLRWQLSVQLPLSLLQYLPLMYFGVRFAPAAATSVARRRFSFFDAWTVTRDRFWALFGSFALIWLIVAVVYVAAFSLAFGDFFLALWPDIASLQRTPEPERARQIFSQVFSPAGLTRVAVFYGAMLVPGVICAILMYGVNARAALAALEEGKIEVAPAT
jgi:hypothetical protein